MVGQVGGYKILRQLGTGQFGTVYLAEGVVPSKRGPSAKPQRVALKILKDPGDPTAKASLSREFELMDQVRHRSLCRFYEYLEDDAAVVMEWIRGVDLRQVLDAMQEREEPVDLKAIAALGCELADCLYQSFSTPGVDGRALNLVHRDLKPENIMLTPSGEVKLLDFGLARVRRPGKPRSRMVMGTPLYMAPEQANGRLVDHRTDLFALGLILYELMMGEPAYEVKEDVEDPEAEVMGRIESGHLEPEIQKVERRFPEVGYMIGRCLQPNPRSRYTNGHELLVDLRGLLPRESGVYLEQFCKYFFSMVHPLAVEPAQNDEPRRVESMSNSKRPPRPSARPPRPSSGGGGGPRKPSASGSRPAAAPPGGRPPGPRTSRARPPGGPPTSPRKPSGPTPPPPKKKKPRFGLGDSQARSASETGMLRMVPLSDDDDVDEAAPSSATQFFAIPKSRTKKKPKPVAGGAPKLGMGSKPPAPGRQLAGPPGGGAPPPPGGALGISGPSMGGGAPPAISGPRPGGGMGIQGPLATGPTAASGSVTPFAEAASHDPPAQSSGSRTRSLRLIAILAMMLLMLGGTLIVGVVALYVAMSDDPFGTANTSSSGSEDVVDVDDEDIGDDDGDEDVMEDVDLSELNTTSRRKSRNRGSSGRSRSSNRSSSGSSSSSGSTASAANSSSGRSSSSSGRSSPKKGPFTIKVSGGEARSVKFSCDDGTSGQISLSSGSGGSGKSIGAGTGCSLSFKTVSGVPKKGSISGGGRTYTCNLSGPRASCK